MAAQLPLEVDVGERVPLGVADDETRRSILGSGSSTDYATTATSPAPGGSHTQAAFDDSDRSLFTQALEQFYDGKPDPRTQELLRSTSPRNGSS